MRRLESGAALAIYDTLDSTNAEAKRRVDAGERGPLWIVAKDQTGGYGRRDRSWHSGSGNFAGTLLFAPNGDPAIFGQLSFVAGLAALDALDAFAHEEALSLKWPNDILAGEAKLAGLLLERIDQAGRPLIAAGFGINLVSAPGKLPYPATSLSACLGTGREIPTPQEFVVRLDRSFDAYLGLWGDRGMGLIRSLWLERAYGVGKPIRVALANEEFSGIFTGIDETGALIVSVDGAPRHVAAGDVMFGV